MTLDELEGRITLSRLSGERAQQHLALIFTNQQEYDDWKEKMARNAVRALRACETARRERPCRRPGP